MLHLNSGKDYRYGGKKDVRTYFWPSNEATNHEVDALFRQIAGGDQFKSGEIEVVQGRHIHVSKYLKCVCGGGVRRSGVCEFDFDELCNKPTGASDYISLCPRACWG